MLELIRIVSKNKHYQTTGLYKCSCGNEKEILTQNVNNGSTKSCGCKKDDHKIKHGLCKTPEYNAYKAMLKRCYNKNNASYKNYGARGIQVCERWRNSFENFLEDMGLKSSPELSLDRINSSDGYYKENCRWGTQIEQHDNRTITVFLKYNGTIQPLAKLAREYNLKASQLHDRVNKLGWSVEEALKTPIMPIGKKRKSCQNNLN